jgi:hypothetical protein
MGAETLTVNNPRVALRRLKILWTPLKNSQKTKAELASADRRGDGVGTDFAGTKLRMRNQVAAGPGDSQRQSRARIEFA